MMQQLQSSPHQQPCLTGTLGPLVLEDVDEAVDGGMVVVVVVVWKGWFLAVLEAWVGECADAGDEGCMRRTGLSR